VPIVTGLTPSPKYWPAVPEKVMLASSPAVEIVTVVAGPPIVIVPVTMLSSCRIRAAGSSVNAKGLEPPVGIARPERV